MVARKPKAPVKPKRGRPQHKPTPETRMQVTMLVAAAMPHESIAQVLRIGRKTLDLRYAAELRDGHADRRAEVIELLWSQARKGNTAATKHLDQMTATTAAEAVFTAMTDAPKAPRLGKKEQAAKAAETAGAGTDWGADLGGDPETIETAH